MSYACTSLFVDTTEMINLYLSFMSEWSMMEKRIRGSSNYPWTVCQRNRAQMNLAVCEFIVQCGVLVVSIHVYPFGACSHITDLRHGSRKPGMIHHNISLYHRTECFPARTEEEVHSRIQRSIWPRGNFFCSIQSTFELGNHLLLTTDTPK